MNLAAEPFDDQVAGRKPGRLGAAPRPSADKRPWARQWNGRSGACEVGILPFVRPSMIGRFDPIQTFLPLRDKDKACPSNDR